jgi:hypothetical protein
VVLKEHKEFKVPKEHKALRA